MSKTRKNRSRKNFFRKMSRRGKNAIPVLKSGLKTVGKTAKVAAVKSAPIIESGVSKIYGALMSGFDLGVKGVKGLSSKMNKKHHTKRRR
jgi:hypothetical protein